jgi:hypothetical protein
VGVVLSRLTVWTAALLMVTAGHGMVCAESDVVIERGMRLDDALKRLQDAGLGIVFSSELVAAGMIVRDAPPWTTCAQRQRPSSVPMVWRSRRGRAGFSLWFGGRPPRRRSKGSR